MDHATIAEVAERIYVIMPYSPDIQLMAVTLNIQSQITDIVFTFLKGYSDAKAAPLMCAGLIGYRSYCMAMAEQDIESLGIFGFGAAAHIITQVAVHMRKKVMHLPVQVTSQLRTLLAGWEQSGLEILQIAHQRTRCCHRFCSHRIACARSSWLNCQRGDGCLRRHPYDRYPLLCLQASLGGEDH